VNMVAKLAATAALSLRVCISILLFRIAAGWEGGGHRGMGIL
jgi:hypothetical protein